MSSAGQNVPKLRVYLVEDHADTLGTLKRYLQGLGHSVECGSTLAEALQALRTHVCDLLVSDVGLADGDGWELLQRLAEQGIPRPAYAAAMSGYGTHADQARSRAAGFQRHLVKPFNLDEFDQVLADAGEAVQAQRN